MGSLRDKAVSGPCVGRKSHKGWYDKLRERSPEAYTELFELVRDYEEGDAELRSKYPSRISFYQSFVRSHLHGLGYEVGKAAFEDFSRRVNGEDRHVQP